LEEKKTYEPSAQGAYTEDVDNIQKIESEALMRLEHLSQVPEGKVLDFINF